MSHEGELREKLRKIEALFAGAGTEGERSAAEAALERIKRRLAEQVRSRPPVELQFNLADEWSRRLFLALCRRYGLSPFRYRRQRYTTVMVVAPSEFIDQVLWPEYQQLNLVLRNYLRQTTERIIRAEVFADTADAAEVDRPTLSGPTDPGAVPTDG